MLEKLSNPHEPPGIGIQITYYRESKTSPDAAKANIGMFGKEFPPISKAIFKD